MAKNAQQTNGNGNSNGNGNGSEDTSSALTKAHEAWLKAGGKLGDPKAIEKAKAALQAADAEMAKAQAAVEAARESRSKAALAMIALVGGKNRVKLADGTILVPACRLDSVFYRSQGEGSTI